jgi:hypothetical protein
MTRRAERVSGRRTVLLSLLGALFAWPTSATRVNAGSHAPRADLCYADLLPTLRLFIESYAMRRINHVYIARVRSDIGQVARYAHWVEGNSILLIEHFAGDPPFADQNQLDWLNRKARIYLKTDVVASKEEVGSSAYLVDRAWANRIRRACIETGHRVTVGKP